MSQTSTNPAVFIGVQLAADRANVAAVSESGEILVESSAPFSKPNTPSVKGTFEINPEIWWDATRLALGHLIGQLRSKVASPSQLKAIAVCSNPGDLVLVDKQGSPLMPAILAEDARAVDQIKSLNYHGQEYCERMGFQFNARSPLAKIAWVKENLPELYENAYFVHQADFIVGRLKGRPDVTEFSLAMRTGCDLLEECWPDWIDYDMHLGVRDRLPALKHLGEKVGEICSKAASATGLPTGLPVVMGTTSQTASFLASGARQLGDFHTVLESGMTISGISPKMIRDPHGQVRIFKLPNRAWFFFVESRTGAEWVHGWFSEGTFPELESNVGDSLPTTYLAYPNARKGETFPFNSSSAEGFISPATDNRTAQFASCLQGTAMFERYCYQKLDRMAGTTENRGEIYSGGEWSGSDSWMQCRADVTGRINRRMVGRAGATFGAAMMAAMGGFFHSLEESAEAMLRSEAVFFPNPERVVQYSELYGNFCALMEEQGYTI